MPYLRRFLPWFLVFNLLAAVSFIGDIYFDGRPHTSDGGIIGSRPVLTVSVIKTNPAEDFNSSDFTLSVDNVPVPASSYWYIPSEEIFRCEFPDALPAGNHKIELGVQSSYGFDSRTVIVNVAEARGLSGDLILFPSPATDNMNVSYELNSAQNVSLMIYDLNGQMVLRRDFGSNQPGGQAGYNQVNVRLEGYGGRFLSNGVYIAVLKSKNSVPVRAKFIIMR